MSSVPRSFSEHLAHWFPRPRLLLPPAAGIDISDASIKWIVLEEGREGKQIRSYGEVALPSGIVVNGVVQNVQMLAGVLHDVKGKLGSIEHAHAALPEEAAFVFSMQVPPSSRREQILSMIEFELEGRVPIPPSASVYDFDCIEKHADGEEIGVVVFPREVAQSYVDSFSAAGLRLLSLELEARSIARAVSRSHIDEPIALLVDFGRQRTGLAAIKRGVPIFTTTVGVGSELIDKAIVEKLSLSPEELDAFKFEEGLLAKEGKNSAGLEVISGAASALADEVAKHYHYWDTRRNERGERMTPLERVYLLGGGANLKGLGDYIASRVQAEVVRPNVWENVCSFGEYIPPIDRRASLQFATAIGLALRSV
ncbi:pilus assembly protein PilM [Candidatus Uhrbacteria bacterium]|nr:pilus assembly protein PilM [Candidatus Uhrbacteria bacterium]